MGKLNFFNELKRRNVYKVAVAYLVTAWLFAQIASILLPAFEAPISLMRSFVLVLAIGFPVALLVAWAYEYTPEGLKLTSSSSKDPTFSLASGKRVNQAIIGVLAFAIILLLVNQFTGNLRGVSGISPLIQSTTIKADLRGKRVAVKVFDNQTMNQDLDPFGMMISDWITQGLMETQQAKVVSDANIRKNLDSDGSGLQYNQKTSTRDNVDVFVEGRYYMQEDRLIVIANLIDATSGEVLFANLKEQGSRDRAMELLDDLTERLLGFWVLGFRKKYQNKPPKYNAYQAYIEALDYWYDMEANPKCEEFLLKAFELDTNYYTPLMKLVQWYSNYRKTDKRDSLLFYLEQKNPPFTKVEKLNFQALQYVQKFDYDKAASSYESVFSIDSMDFESNYAAGYYYYQANKPKQSIQVFESYLLRDGDGQLKKTNWNSYLAGAHFKLANYPKVIEVVNRIKTSEVPYDLASIHLRSLVRMDSLAVIDKFLKAYESNEFIFADPAELWFSVCFELQRNGHDELLKKYASEYAAKAVEYKSWGAMETNLYQAYFFLGDYQKSLSYIEINDLSHNLDISFAGACYAAIGDDLQAQNMMDFLKPQHGLYNLYFSKEYYVARIEANLGNKDKAVDMLKIAIEKGAPFALRWFQDDMLLLPLQGHPPFEALMAPID